MPEDSNEKTKRISLKNVISAEIMAGLEFDDNKRKLLLEGVNNYLEKYEKLREIKVDNNISPAFYFNPLPKKYTISKKNKSFIVSPAPSLEIPNDIEELAFWPISHLSYVIKNEKITSIELTKMYIDRLKRFDKLLKCVITITEDLAIEQAEKADLEISKGNYLGYLHGIPYGVKDLFAFPSYPTTWGANPYKKQQIDESATVIKRLEKAGAVLIAKLSLGALAWGDVWFDGKTKSPWNIEEGSSGSSAGSAAATSAGLVGFALGTETWGSIVSPATQCGATGLRPSFGRISRFGAMALSWSMDKIGTISRYVEDCAIIFDIIKGPDGNDQSVVDYPFNWDYSVNIEELRIGYLKSAFDEDRENKGNDKETLDQLQSLGLELTSIDLPNIPIEALSFILSAEAATAFDDLTLSNRDEEMIRQVKDAWPNVFRQARFIPAVEYIKANRIRTLLIEEMAKLFENIDLYIAPSFNKNLLLTNLTGHPAIVVPNGFRENGIPTSITFTGNLFREDQILAVAKAYQDSTDFHTLHPPLFINNK